MKKVKKNLDLKTAKIQVKNPNNIDYPERAILFGNIIVDDIEYQKAVWCPYRGTSSVMRKYEALSPKRNIGFKIIKYVGICNK